MRLLALFLVLTSVYAGDASRLLSIQKPEDLVRGRGDPDKRPFSLRRRFLQDTPVTATRPSPDANGGSTGGGGGGAGESNNDGGDDEDDGNGGNGDEGNGGREKRDRDNRGVILEMPAPTTRRPTRAPTISPTVSYQERQEKPENQALQLVGGTLFVITKPPIEEPIRTTLVPTIRHTGTQFTISKFPTPAEPGPTAKPTPMPIPDLSLLLLAPTSAPVTLPPTGSPLKEPTTTPTGRPSESLSNPPTGMPSESPTTSPTTFSPSRAPSAASTTLNPSESPIVPPSTLSPSVVLTKVPSTAFPSNVPSISETTTNNPSDFPSKAPVASLEPTEAPSPSPTSEEPTDAPSLSQTTENPTEAPSVSPTSEEPTQPELPDSGPLFPAIEIDPSRQVPTRETAASNSDAPSSNPSDSISTTSAPTLTSTTTATDQDTSYFYSELQQLQGASELSTISLKFSLWFPHHRVNNLNITRVENDVLSSLEVLFCDIHSPAVNIIETSDNVCVLEDDLVLGQDTTLASARAPQQITSAHIMDATILRAPYVTHLDERYAFEAGGRVSWTTWEVQWEVLQVGVPVLEKGIQQLELRTGVLKAEEAYVAGVQEVQKRMRDAMTSSIRTGDFDIILQSKLQSVTALSSPVGNELGTFDFLSGTGAKHSDRGVDQATENESGSDANRNKTIVAAIVGVAFCVGIAFFSYFSIRPRSPRNLWKREREQHILDAIEQEACKEHHLHSKREQPLRSSSTSEEQGSTDAVEPTEGVGSAESVPVPSVYMRNVDDISEHPEDQVSSLESVGYQWSVDGVDAEWKPWPSTSHDDSFGDI